MTKDFMLRARLDASDKERLERVAAHYTLSHAALIRMLVKRECDAIDLQQPKKTKK
jgi:antitoxin component of RelBE/YafQ-DinJ toxin-antitoxin module